MSRCEGNSTSSGSAMQRRAHRNGLLPAPHVDAAHDLALPVQFALDAVFHLPHHHHVIEALTGQFGLGGQRGFFRWGGLKRTHADNGQYNAHPVA